MSSGTSASQVQQASQAFNAAQAKGDTAGMAAARASIGVNADGSGNLGSVTPSAVNYSGLVLSTPTATSNKGYYDSSLGYYVGSPGMTDAQRTQEAINYYKQNNMTDKLNSALNYSVDKGYTPSFTDYAYKNNIGYDYNSGNNTLAINGQTYNNGSIPGLTLINGRNYVTDASLLPFAQGNPKTPLMPDVPFAQPDPKTPLRPDVPVAQPDLSTLLLERIENIQMPEMPVYQPYQQQAFQYTAPNYSITANPADTSFIPTARAKDRWLQQEQANADEAYKGYSSQYNAYQQGYNATQDAIANALSLLPYSEMTAQQKATIEQQQAQDALQYEIDKAKADIEAGKWTNSEEYAQLQANLIKAQTAKAQRDAGAPYSKGGSSGDDGSGGSGGNPTYYQAALVEMAAGQNRYRKDAASGKKLNPHNYTSYVQTAINKANMAGQPLSTKQIESLMKQSNYMTSDDTAWMKLRSGTKG